MGKSTKKALSRIERIQLQLEKQQRELALQKALADHKKSNQTLTKWVKHIHTEKQPPNCEIGTVQLLIAGLFHELTKKDERKRQAFAQLLMHLEKQHCLRLLSEGKYVKGIFAIACQAPYFIRPIASWKRRSHQPEKQFSHLLRHLFTQYAVPLFLDKAWLPGGNLHEQRWFIDLGNGVSVRKLSFLPIVLSKKMAHAFLQAPFYCTISGAFRYAQVVALGGDEWLAWYINQTIVGRNGFQHDDFWLSVIRFFAAAPLFDARRIEEVVDFINYQRLAQEGFSMKGRTPDALLRQTEEWHAQRSLERNYGGAFKWQPSGIRAFDQAEGSGTEVKIYKIRELLSSNELLAEGKAMKHCVYTYVRSCMGQSCAIFSLTVDTVSGPQRLATLEVDLKRQKIVQAKARCNDTPSAEAMQVILKWATAEKIKISTWL